MSEMIQKVDFREVKIAKKAMPFWLKAIFQSLFFLIVAFLLIVAVFQYIFFCPVVHQDSMYPMLNYEVGKAEDSVYVNRYGKINVGNVIVTNYEINGKVQPNVVIKRVIAMAGDTFAVVKTSLPGEPDTYGIILQRKGESEPKLLNEPYLAEGTIMVKKQEEFEKTLYASTANSLQRRMLTWGEGGVSVKALLVPDKYIFFLGDNRDGIGPSGLNSSDCMNLGFQKTSLIRGRVDAIVYESKDKFLCALRLIFSVSSPEQKALLFPVY